MNLKRTMGQVGFWMVGAATAVALLAQPLLAQSPTPLPQRTIIPPATFTPTPTLATPTATFTPTVTLTPSPTPSASPTPRCQQPAIQTHYLPFAYSLQSATPSPLPPPLPTPTLLTSETVVDWTAVTAQLRAQGLLISPNKIGFHMGYGGNITGLHDWMVALDNACIPFFLKSVDVAGTLYEAQQLELTSGVPHILVYRRTGIDYDVPDYSLSPEEAAIAHWNLHKSVFPPELDPSRLWLETVNEVDKNRSEWLAEFSLKTAQLAVADGFRWAAFGWSSGEPEPEHWEGPHMLEFLRYAGNHPHDVAIALHEYSYVVGDIGNSYPYLIGRLQKLFAICDAHHIPRPTILITEWGWEYQTVPAPEQALQDIAWASRLYAAYPEVQGAAIWYLGGGFGGIADLTQQLIAPVQDYSLHNYFAVTPGRGTINPALFPPPLPLWQRPQ